MNINETGISMEQFKVGDLVILLDKKICQIQAISKDNTKVLLDTGEIPHSDNWWNITQCKLWYPKPREKVLKILKDIVDKYFDMTEEELRAYFNEATAELEGYMKLKTCEGCKRRHFILTELSKRNGGKCGTCKRFVKDNYEAEKDNK